MLSTYLRGNIYITVSLPAGMTSLELWCFYCITCTFLALLTYVLILLRLRLTGRLKINNMPAAVKPQDDGGDTGSRLPNDVTTKADTQIEIVLAFTTIGCFVIFNIYFLLIHSAWAQS